MENNNGIKKIVMFAVVIIIFALGAILGSYAQSKKSVKNSIPAESPYAEGNSYSVVYLSTGEIYIGHLTVSPKMELTDGYLLQTIKDAKDETKSNIQLTPLKEALWAPKRLFLNEKNVIFYGPIEEGSKAAEAIRNAGK